MGKPPRPLGFMCQAASYACKVFFPYQTVNRKAYFACKIGHGCGVPKLSDQVSVRIDPEWRDVLRSIEEKHRIPPPEFIRGLVDAGLQFYREHGWFAFPVNVQPLNDYIQAVAETQSTYHAKPMPKAKKNPSK